jgi:hypothetical protein
MEQGGKNKDGRLTLFFEERLQPLKPGVHLADRKPL